jgi:hypothetical protein
MLYPLCMIETISELSAMDTPPIFYPIGLGGVAGILPGSGMMGWPPIRVPDLMTANYFRVMPRSPDLFVGHNYDDAHTREADGTGQGGATELGARTGFPDVLLAGDQLVVKPALVGFIERLGREELGLG